MPDNRYKDMLQTAFRSSYPISGTQYDLRKLEAEYAQAKAEYTRLEAEYQDISARLADTSLQTSMLNDLMEKERSMDGEIDALLRRRAALGIFSIGQKKTLDTQIDFLRKIKDETVQRILQLKREMSQNSNASDADRLKKMLPEQLKKVALLHERIISVKGQQGANTAVNLCRPTYYLDKKFTKVNKTIDLIETYLSRAHLLYVKGYTVQKNVLPEVLNAEAYIDEIELDDWNCLHEGVPFDVNNYGKPISLLISKSGAPALAIVVMNTLSQKLNRAHTVWIKNWSERNKVPLLQIYPDMPNEEDYIVKTVYKRLGII